MTALIILKIGGSLMRYPTRLKSLCKALAGVSGVLITPGGGSFADAVREAYTVYGLSEEAAHAMALAAMDQYGLLLSDLIPNSVATVTLRDAELALCRGSVPVFLPADFARAERSLERSWRVTSDSISVAIAAAAGAEKLILVKDVDGVFSEDPKGNRGARLLTHITTAELRSLPSSCLDDAFPDLLEAAGIRCVVVNGLFSKRVLAAIHGEETISTVIEPVPPVSQR